MTDLCSTEPCKPIEDFFACVSDEPLALAFAGRRPVHPFVGLSPVPDSEWTQTWTEMTSSARRGKSLAYIHVPFCETHCLFCGFYQHAWHPSLGRRYVDALIDHLRRDRDQPYQSGVPIQAVYFGGGTPTLLSAADLARAIEAVREHLPGRPSWSGTARTSSRRRIPRPTASCRSR